MNGYQIRMMKKIKKHREYSDAVKARSLIARERTIQEFEAAYMAVFESKPKRIPANQKTIKLETSKLWATLHTRGITNGLDD